jgi:uncharacterized protein
VPERLTEPVRTRASADSPVADPGDTGSDDAGGGIWRQLRRPERWAASAAYTVSDLRMLRREIALGFLMAGFVAVAVPAHVWSDFFLTGHGALTTVENAAVGPLVAIISFVCSIGNVALAAALWHDGISFGGVVAFVFADLITIPLLLAYRTMYGGRITLRLLAAFWPVMSVSGLVTEVAFRALHGVPGRRPGTVVPEHFAWNATAVLNILFVAGFAGLIWLYRRRDRFGGAGGLAVDPVCRMQVDPAHPGATWQAPDGSTVSFCSSRCRDRFVDDLVRSPS